MIKKKQFAVLLAAILVVIMVGAVVYFYLAREEKPLPHVVAIVPDWSGFVDWAEVETWGFGGTLLTTSAEPLEARFIGAQIGGQFAASLGEDEWTEVIRLGKQAEDELDEYEKLHRLVVEQQAGRRRISPDITPDIITARYEKARWDLQMIIGQEVEKGRIEWTGITILIPPMQITLGETEVVELIFEVRKKDEPTVRWQMTAPTSVTNLALPREGIPEPAGIPEE